MTGRRKAISRLGRAKEEGPRAAKGSLTPPRPSKSTYPEHLKKLMVLSGRFHALIFSVSKSVIKENLLSGVDGTLDRLHRVLACIVEQR